MQDDDNIDWHAFLKDSVLTDDDSTTTTTTTANPEPPLVLRKHSPELTSWLLEEPICRSLMPSYYRHHPSHKDRMRLPHARFARANDLRRTVSICCARERIFSDDDRDAIPVPMGTPWPPGATGRLRHPPRLRPGAKGLRAVGFDVPRNYAGKKKVWSHSEWFVPEPTRLGREVWTIDEGARGGIRVDEGERDEDVVMGGTDENGTDAQEGVAVDGEFDIPFPPLTRSSEPSYHGPLREYAGYVSDDDSDSDSDSGSDSDDSDDDDSDDESRSSGRFLRLGERMVQDADDDDVQKITDAFAAFDGDHTGVAGYDDNAAYTNGSRFCG
ncbi:hypothetical protein DIS24_g409 [Lasiodiplodia hormozganensis]|uniref:Uncharacterized protein n=1 Tax=Lasiodiplodia hormozganensis TaxID=869390 RepID=A0AA39Z789_9PEZI|nr:hypothetical protein DIS24_g409 [Lasiodiplodia hormozganensis]